MSELETHHARPTPKRPRWGWIAWESVVGYIAQQHNPDATLKVEIYPGEHIIGWAASITWGANLEEVKDKHSFQEVLSDLWLVVKQNHDLLQSPYAAAKQPIDYDNDDWLDDKTYEVFSRLVNVTDTALRTDWRIIILYRPVEEAAARLQTRLLTKGQTKGGRGPTLRDACRDLYHNAIPIYQSYRQQNDT